MNQNRKKYDKEFKKEAVELSYARGDATEIAEELGIDRALLSRWRKEFNQYNENSFPGHGNPKLTDLERERTFAKRVERCQNGARYPKKGNQHLLRERWEIY